MTSFTTSNSNEMRLFGGGLKNVQKGAYRLEMNKYNNMYDHHDFLNYERGTICRSRSPYNQYLDYHAMYGGARNFFATR